MLAQPHTPTRRFGVLGGTFDPPHIGHLALAQEVYARRALDRVWFLPTGSPPHKQGQPISPAQQRRAMVERAIMGDERFALCDVELERPGPSYTVDTLRQLRAEWGAETHICFIVGWDMLAFLPQWHDAPGVLAALDQLAAVHRPGFVEEDEAQPQLERLEAQLPGLRAKLTLLPAPQFDVSSSDLRERVAAGLPIRYLVPDAVRAYIAEQALYR
ncbi:MAG TPA: nicotinate-nucleotide adenylyltransferase [Ktedonobacterales bacterium]|nr:nicotinate-nucleotide adenylyltransferase [Ktedonobacterales bacterium]